MELWKGRKGNVFVILLESKKGSIWKVKMAGYANGNAEKGCRKVAVREIKEDKFSS